MRNLTEKEMHFVAGGVDPNPKQETEYRWETTRPDPTFVHFVLPIMYPPTIPAQLQ